MNITEWLVLGIYILIGVVCIGWVEWDCRKRYRRYLAMVAWQKAQVARNHQVSKQKHDLCYELECERALLTNSPLPKPTQWRPSPWDDPYPDWVWK